MEIIGWMSGALAYRGLTKPILVSCMKPRMSSDIPLIPLGLVQLRIRPVADAGILPLAAFEPLRHL